MSKLYFFRHAQASYLSDNYDELSSHGEQQAVMLGAYLIASKVQFDRTFVGPLERQKETFEVVASVYKSNGLMMPKAIQLEGLKEHLAVEAMKAAYPELINTVPEVRKWVAEAAADLSLARKNTLLIFRYFIQEWAMDNIQVPNIESWQAFRSKVKKCLAQILEQTGKSENIGIFTSGGTISAITAEALNIKDEKKVANLNLSIRNASFSTFLFSKNQFNLFGFNEAPHLPKEMITFI